MATLTRIPENPILIPNPEHSWEHDGAFNPCVVHVDGVYHMVYRAQSATQVQNGVTMQVSSIGYAKSTDGINFTDHKQIIAPTEDWEIYGCEDPRITYLDGKFYIFYTALSVYPFAAYGIKLAVALTHDFQNFEKHPVTTFNSKAMALFPDRVSGKLSALLTINTDLPPAKIAFVQFDTEEDIWSPIFWSQWFEEVNSHTVHLLRNMQDQVELGAPPIKTSYGWLVIYSYIRNYLSSHDKTFGIEAVLLDCDNPRVIRGRTTLPLLKPEEKYELEGNVPNIVFPSGSLVKEDKLYVYYGAADTRGALAICHLDSLLDLVKPIEGGILTPTSDPNMFTRYEGNPIITPALELDWQKQGTFNPAAIYEGGKVHLIYRAQSEDGTSRLGYASSKDGFHIDENLDYPIYEPREPFEKKMTKEGNSGCEDPRITKIGERFYMTYTAYDGVNPPRVALTTIAVSDFMQKKWNWEKPKLISPPGVDDKDACIIKKVRGEGYVAFHRLGDAIWLDRLRDLDFPERKYLTGGIIYQARKDKWDNVKVGLSAPPIETEHGWILLYHGVSEPGFIYKVGAMLLDYDDPRKILAITDEPIFEPETPYETKGQVPFVVFPCGAIMINGLVFIYYGGADKVIGVATMPLENLIKVIMQK